MKKHWKEKKLRKQGKEGGLWGLCEQCMLLRRNTAAHLDTMQFSKRAVIVTFTFCGSAGWTLLLLEKLESWHSGREAGKCHVAHIFVWSIEFYSWLVQTTDKQGPTKPNCGQHNIKKTTSRRTQLKRLAEMWIWITFRQTILMINTRTQVFNLFKPCLNVVWAQFAA